jgi:hypothetical protein
MRVSAGRLGLLTKMREISITELGLEKVASIETA